MGATIAEDEKIVTEEVAESTQEETATESEVSQPKTKQVQIADVSEEAEEEKEQSDSTEVSEEKEEEEDSSLKEKNVPFNKQPEFKKRLDAIEKKYSTKVSLWEEVVNISKDNPELGKSLMKELESRGKLPAGSYELALQREQKVQSAPVNDELDSRPEIQYAKQLYMKKQEEEAHEAVRRENVLIQFEEKHPDIAERENASVIRARIAVLEEAYKEEGLGEEEALDAAYDTLFNRSSLLAKEREKGEVVGQIKAQTKSIVSTPSGSGEAAPTPVRKLTREEEEARSILGMTREEYVQHKDAMKNEDY